MDVLWMLFGVGVLCLVIGVALLIFVDNLTGDLSIFAMGIAVVGVLFIMAGFFIVGSEFIRS